MLSQPSPPHFTLLLCALLYFPPSLPRAHSILTFFSCFPPSLLLPPPLRSLDPLLHPLFPSPPSLFKPFRTLYFPSTCTATSLLRHPFLYFSNPSPPLHHSDPFSPATPSSLCTSNLPTSFSLSLYFPLHTFLFSLRTSAPSSFPSTSTPLLSSTPFSPTHLAPLLLLHFTTLSPYLCLPSSLYLLSNFPTSNFLSPSFPGFRVQGSGFPTGFNGSGSGC